MAFQLTQHKNRELTGGDLLAQSLKHIGTTVAFGVHGGHLDAFLMGCDYIGIKLVDTRHETVAVQAAEGYSKVARKLGVCFITANSGFSNGLPGIATAFADRSPIFIVTSSPPLRDLENNSLQAFHDQVVVAKPVTKFAHRVTHPEDIPRLVAHAVRVAVGGSPGPVLIDFPIDVLFTPIHEERISWGAIASPLPLKPGPSVRAVKETIELLKASKRPAIISGTGAGAVEDAKALLNFAEKTGIPIFQSPKYAPLPVDHPNVAGFAGSLPFANPRPDLIILLGSRTGMYLGLRSGAIIPHEAKLIHVDIDGTEPGRTLPTHLAVTSSASEFIAALATAVEPTPFKAPDSWLKHTQSLQHIESEHVKEADYPTPGKMHPYKAIATLFSSLPSGAIVITDGGEAGNWTISLNSLNKPLLHITATGYLGFLGNGFGYAMGAAVARPDALVVNCQGDGSAGFHFMELDSYARFGLNIATVVINNVGWGMSKNGQELVYGKTDAARPASSLADVKWEMVAEGLGVKGVKIDKLDDIASKVKALFGQATGSTGDAASAAGPKCINLVVSPQPIHPGTKVMVGMTDDPNVVVVPYYDNIPRAYYK